MDPLFLLLFHLHPLPLFILLLPPFRLDLVLKSLLELMLLSLLCSFLIGLIHDRFLAVPVQNVATVRDVEDTVRGGSAVEVWLSILGFLKSGLLTYH
jgi:hypothetical protein